MGFVLVVSTFGPWFLWPTRMTLVGRQLGFARQRLQRHGQLGDGHFAERLPLRLGKRNPHALIHTLDFVEQVIRRYVFLHHVTSVDRRNAARTTASTLYATSDTQKANNPAFGYPSRVCSLSNADSKIWNSVSIFQRFRYKPATTLAWSRAGRLVNTWITGRHRGSASANATQVVARSGFRRSRGCPAEPFAPTPPRHRFRPRTPVP